MSLTSYDSERLSRAGFLDYEIQQLASATAPDGSPQPSIDLSSPAWQSTLESRISWVQDKVGRGWTKEEIENTLMNYYSGASDRSPWDFLKAEYRPRKRVDYLTALANRKKRIIQNALGEY